MSGRIGGSGYERLSRGQTGEPTLPLINVVFLLLIFVLLTSVIEADPPVPVELAFSDTSPLAETTGEVVFLSADGQKASALSVLDDSGIEAWVDENKPEVVAIRADKQTRISVLFRLRDRLQELGVKHIELAVLAP